MFRFSIKPKQGEDLKLRKLQNAWAKTVVLGTLETCAMFAQREVKAETPVDTATARKSWAVRWDEEVSLGRATGELYSELEYMTVLEEGRGAGEKMPPDAPIRRWVERHRAKFSGALRKYGLSGVTYMVRRGIAQRGTKPHKMAANAAEKTQSRATEFASKQIDKFLRQTGGTK